MAVGWDLKCQIDSCKAPNPLAFTYFSSMIASLILPNPADLGVAQNPMSQGVTLAQPLSSFS